MNRPILHPIADAPDVRKLNDRQFVVAIEGQPVADCASRELAEVVATALYKLQLSGCPHPPAAIRFRQEPFYNWEYGLTDYEEFHVCELCGERIREPIATELNLAEAALT